MEKINNNGMHFSCLHTGIVKAPSVNGIDVPMKENEAYVTVRVTHHIKTLPNKAYGTL